MARLSATQAISKKRFRVRIDGVPPISFSMAEGLGYEIEYGEYMDGTENDKLYKPGNVTYDDLVLTAGEAQESLQPLYTWHEQLVNAKENGGLIGDELGKNIDVEILDEAGGVIMTWRNEKCFSQRLEPDTREGAVSDVAVAKLTVKVTKRRAIFGDAVG